MNPREKVTRNAVWATALVAALAAVPAPAQVVEAPRPLRTESSKADGESVAVDGREGAAPLTLEQIYVLVSERNPRIRAAEALAGASRAREPGASLPPDPFFQVGVMNFSVPDLDADMPTSMAPSLRLMQMIPFPGKLSASGRIAERTTAMLRADARETRWERRSAAAMAFYDIYAVDRQLEVMRETLRLLMDFEQVARALYTAGAGRQTDVLRANVEIARMEAEIARIEAMRDVAAARLNAVLDRPADTPIPSVLYPRLPLDTPGVDTLRDWAETSRPMLDRGRAGVERARSQGSLANRELWPDFTIGFEYGQRSADMGTERMGSAMIGFTLPIFAGGRQLRMRDEAAAMERMAAADLAEMRARVDGRIGELVADLERARTLIDLYRSEVLPQAGANVESALSSYRVGAVDFLTLVDAQMTLNRYEQELFRLLADYGTGVAELEMTIGRELPVTDPLVAEAR